MPQPETLPDAPAEPESLPDAAAVAPAEHPLPINIGRIAEQYLRSSYGKGADHSHYELKDKNGQFYIGKDPIKTDGNDWVIKGKRYRGTPGLWQLITMKEPEIRFPTKDDMKNYGEIMVKADAIRHPINSETPYYEKSFKWKKFIKPIWDEYVKKTNKKQSEKRNVNRKKNKEKAFSQAIQTLCERLELLMASKHAVSTGLRNEIVSMCDELLRQKILSRDAYKNLMLALNKVVNY